MAHAWTPAIGIQSNGVWIEGFWNFGHSARDKRQAPHVLHALLTFCFPAHTKDTAMPWQLETQCFELGFRLLLTGLPKTSMKGPAIQVFCVVWSNSLE